MAYRVEYTFSAKEDIKSAKKYILDYFRYRQYAESYTKKIKEAEARLRNLPTLPPSIGFYYRGYEIYLMVHKKYLLPYIVDGKTITVIRVFEDGMDWKRILERWIKQNR